MDRRTKAREFAMQGLYQLDVQGSDVMEFLGEGFVEARADDFIRNLAYEWIRGTWEHLATCDELISVSTLKWKFERLSPVDRSILRLAVYQLKFCPDIPAKVVINEAIELAKKFSTDKSPAFVNGVLDAVFKKTEIGDS